MEPDVTFVFDATLHERKKRLTKNRRLRNTIFFKKENFRKEGNLYKCIFDRYKNKWKMYF